MSAEEHVPTACTDMRCNACHTISLACQVDDLRTEVERLREGAASSGIHWAQEKRRAEDAEAEVARLTRLLEQRTAALTRTIDAKNAAEAQIARVEALMVHLHTDLIHISDLRAALKGDQ